MARTKQRSAAQKRERLKQQRQEAQNVQAKTEQVSAAQESEQVEQLEQEGQNVQKETEHVSVVQESEQVEQPQRETQNVQAKAKQTSMTQEREQVKQQREQAQSAQARTKQRSAAQKREQVRRQREQAQSAQAKTRSARGRKRPTRTNPWPLIGAIVLVVVVVIGIFIYLSNQQNTVSTQQAATAFKTASTIDAQTFSSVGGGSIQPGYLHPVKTAVLKGPDGKPEILYVGGEYCPYCATQRWGMIAALSRFGTLSPLTPISSSEDSIPTFTFEGYKYSSPYIDLVAKETAGQSQTTPLDTLTAQEQQIFNTYDSTQYMGANATAGAIPFISIANQYVSQGSYASPSILQGLSYQQIAQQLQDPTTDVAKGIIGTANYLTAAICKVTNNQPADVCTANPIPTLQTSLVQAQNTSGAPQLALVPDTNAIDVRKQA
jgi:thiol-disulfide isomerase/thioredoxin